MNWKIEGRIAEGGFHVVKIDGVELVMSIADPGGHIAHEATIPIVTLCQLFSASEDGRQAMCEALTTAGWTCCPPGSEERWIVKEPEERGSTGEEHVFNRESDARDFFRPPLPKAVRYVRAPEGGSDGR